VFEGLTARRALVTIASGAALVLLGFVFAAEPLLVCGLGLALIGAVAPVWVWSTARGARVRRVLAIDRVTEGELVAARIEITRSRLPLGLPGAEIQDPLSGRRLAVSSSRAGWGPFTQRGRTTSIDVRGRLDRRGEHAIAAPSLDAGDPFGLAAVHVEGAGPADTVLVLPRTERVHWLTAPGTLVADRAAGDAAGEALAATDLDGLRPYRPGTPASRIHWPAVARGHGLIERRLMTDGDSRPLVVLDGRHRGTGPNPPGRDALDAAVRATASLALELARRGGCGLVLPGDQRPALLDSELLGWPAIHARLARVGAELPVPPPRIPAGARRGALIYVTALGPDQVAGGLARSYPRTVLVVPETILHGGRPREAGAGAAVLRVSGCQGFSLRARAARGPTRPAPPAATGQLP
jgi:uncharacterized protein (DUF58 family)